VPFRELFRGAGGGLLEDAGGGAGASLAGEEEGGAAGDGVLEGEAATWVVFSRTGGTKGYGRPISYEPAPMLQASVSSYSAGEEVSSSMRRCFCFGAALPELVLPPRGEE
jgi:hypothetical protein